MLLLLLLLRVLHCHHLGIVLALSVGVELAGVGVVHEGRRVYHAGHATRRRVGVVHMREAIAIVVLHGRLIHPGAHSGHLSATAIGSAAGGGCEVRMEVRDRKRCSQPLLVVVCFGT